LPRSGWRRLRRGSPDGSAARGGSPRRGERHATT
jgi:hypothetical protein